ncbi:MAG: cytochrome P450 [Novosphingobium sp.]|nr:cytochrome P450 [Novosphingobium sp.]
MVITREEELELVDPASYHAKGYPWQTWEKLRRYDPIHFVEREGRDSFWAVTRYQDIVEIERNTDVFRNRPKSTIDVEAQHGMNMAAMMDPPEHTAHRAFAKPFFMPRNIEWVRAYAEEIVTDAFDAAMARNGEIIDLQHDIANLVPTATIAAFLGAPRESWGDIVRLTDTIINANDPRVRGEQSVMQTTMQASMQLFQICAGILEDRRARPRDDFPTALVNARINGEPMSQVDLMSWVLILLTAGHETTQSTFGLGVKTLLDHPDQLARLRARPELLPSAIEEILRYVSPAIHFCRTPVCDIEIGGKEIRAGDIMVMFYPSGNRDEQAFAEPDRFDIERMPNRHLAFGTGPHLCLGMHLARLELRVMFEQFLERVEDIELVGEPERVYGVPTGGYKRLPARMTVRPRS